MSLDNATSFLGFVVSTIDDNLQSSPKSSEQLYRPLGLTKDYSHSVFDDTIGYKKGRNTRKCSTSMYSRRLNKLLIDVNFLQILGWVSMN